MHDDEEVKLFQARPKPRFWTRFRPSAFFFGTFEGQMTGMAVLSLVTVLFGAVVLMLGSDGKGYYNSGFFWEAWWFSWTLFIDPGTQTGLASDETHDLKGIAVLLSLLGFVFNLTILGLVVDNIRAVLLDFKERESRVTIHDHVLVLGWSRML